MNYQKIYEKLKSQERNFANYNCTEEIIEDLISEGFKKEMAELIYSYAYECGHSNGWEEILSYACRYEEFAKDLLKFV